MFYSRSVRRPVTKIRIDRVAALGALERFASPSWVARNVGEMFATVTVGDAHALRLMAPEERNVARLNQMVNCHCALLASC